MTVAAVIPPEVHDVHLRLGYRSGGCGRCFPEWTTWFADARARRLRPMVSGGIPLDPSLTAEQVCPSVRPSAADLAVRFSRPGAAD